MDPWFSPLQIMLSLGITAPLFIYYSWRIYCLVIEHHASIKKLQDKKWINDALPENWKKDELSAQLALNSVFLKFDKGPGTIRRSLRADIYTIILIGFIGTLLGMIGSFTTLLLAVGSKGLDPALAITTLVKGGLSTALVSSLIAAILASIVMAYLSFTDKKLVTIKEKINKECLKRYCQEEVEINEEEIPIETPEITEVPDVSE